MTHKFLWINERMVLKFVYFVLYQKWREGLILQLLLWLIFATLQTLTKCRVVGLSLVQNLSTCSLLYHFSFSEITDAQVVQKLSAIDTG